MEKEVNKILERLSMQVISLDEARAEMRILGLFNVVWQSEQLPEHEKWIKISNAINKAKKKRQDQGFNLGVVKGGLYSMGFEDAIKWLLGNEL